MPIQTPVMDLPEKKQPYRFVLQEHIRGKSSHLDLRFEVNNNLVGFTLDDPGRVGDPLRFRNDAEYSSSHKVLAQLKARQPKEWIDMEGEIDPGKVGAAKNLPAKFKIIDNGVYDMGAQKPALLEVFLNGEKYKGRFIFRKLSRGTMQEKTGKDPFAWFGWKPVDQTPYVLSSRSRQMKWVPPQGRSALPQDWEEKIPAELRWWEKNWTGDKAHSTIESIRELFLKRNILSLDELDSKGIPKPSGKLKDIELTDEQKGLIIYKSKFSSASLSEIASEVGCSKQSVIYWQKKMGMR